MPYGASTAPALGDASALRQEPARKAHARKRTQGCCYGLVGGQDDCPQLSRITSSCPRDSSAWGGAKMLGAGAVLPPAATFSLMPVAEGGSTTGKNPTQPLQGEGGGPVRGRRPMNAMVGGGRTRVYERYRGVGVSATKRSTHVSGRAHAGPDPSQRPDTRSLPGWWWGWTPLVPLVPGCPHPLFPATTHSWSAAGEYSAPMM